jgi:YD repeat-containing protein
MRQSQGPDIGTTTFGFDGEHLVSRADSAGGSVAWTYDPIGRVDSMTVSDPLVGALHTTWAYDGSLLGLVDAASNAHSTSLFQYDDLGRAIHTDRIYADGTVLSSGATLDHRGRVTDEWTPGGAHVQATWGWGFKQQETVDGQVLSYAYDDAGNRVSASSSAGVDLHWTFGTTPRFPDSARMEAAGLTWSIHETHRGNDFLDSVQLLTPFAVLPPQTYGYDARGQLTEVVEAGAVVESFGYDLAGNLRTLREPSGTLWNYDLAGTGGTVGNQVGRRTDGTTVQTSTFDASGRTSTFDDGTIVEEYLYDGLGRLRAVRVGGVVIRELRRDHTDALIATLEGGATTYQFGSYRLNSATGDTSETLAGPLSKRNGARLWNLAGSDGEVRVSIDDAGVEQGTRMSSAYGQPAATTGTTWDQNAFHGMPMSGATMVAAGPRHLPLRDGTWLQPEPLLVSGQMGDLTQPLTFAMNRYSANAPTVMHDRSGMAPERRKSLKGVPPSVPEAEVTYPSGPPRGLPQMPDGTKITFRPVIDGVELRFDTDGNIAATLAKIKLSGPHAVNLRVRQAADGEYSTQVATPVGDFILAQDGSGRWDPGIRVPIAGGTIAVIAKNGFDGIEGNEALVISVYYGPVGVSKSVTREDMDQAASDAYDLFLDQCGPKCVMPEDLFWAYEDAFGHLPEPPSEY